MFSLNKPVKTLRKTGSLSSLLNRKLSRIILTNFSDVFFEKTRKSLRKTGSFFLGEPEVVF